MRLGLKLGLVVAAITMAIAPVVTTPTAAPATTTPVSLHTAGKTRALFAGQSLQAYWFTRGGPRVGVSLCRWLHTEFGFASNGRDCATRKPLDFQGLWYRNYLQVSDSSGLSSTDNTVTIDDQASGGSALEDNSSDKETNPTTSSSGYGNYWWNTRANNGTYTYDTTKATTATFASGATTITIPTSAVANYGVGTLIDAAGLRDMTRVSSINTSTGVITLSNKTTAAGSGVALNVVTNGTGQAADNTADSPGPLARDTLGVLQSGQIDFIVWDQGTTDIFSIASASAKAQYKKTLQELFTYFRTAANNPNLPIVITLLGTDQTNIDIGTQYIREAQLETANEMPYIYFVTEGYDVRWATTGTRVCNTTSGSTSLTCTISMSKGAYISGAGIVEGTYITSASGTTVTMSIAATATAANSNVFTLDTVHRYPGSDGIQPADTDTDGDGVPDSHNQIDGFYKTAHRLAHNLPRIVGTTHSTVLGPRVTSVSAPGGVNYVDLTVTQDEGSALQNSYGLPVSSGVSQFGVFVNGTRVYPSSETITGNVIRLTLPSNYAVGNTLDIYPLYGANNKHSYQIYLNDNSTYTMPLFPDSPTANAALHKVAGQ